MCLSCVSLNNQVPNLQLCLHTLLPQIGAISYIPLDCIVPFVNVRHLKYKLPNSRPVLCKSMQKLYTNIGVVPEVRQICQSQYIGIWCLVTEFHI